MDLNEFVKGMVAITGGDEDDDGELDDVELDYGATEAAKVVAVAAAAAEVS